MSKKNTGGSPKKGSNVGNWFGRIFFGGGNHLAAEMEDQQGRAAAASDVEEIISPGQQIVRNFMERKLAVGALIVLILMFVVMFVGPLFMPKYYDAYTETTQQNVPPGMNMMAIPQELKNDIKMIDGFGSFTVGLSNAGKVYVWGSTKISTTGVDVSIIPQEVQDAKIAMVAAGIDHIVAIGEDGKVYCWGYSKLGQYGTASEALAGGRI